MLKLLHNSLSYKVLVFSVSPQIGVLFGGVSTLQLLQPILNRKLTQVS